MNLLKQLYKSTLKITQESYRKIGKNTKQITKYYWLSKIKKDLNKWKALLC